MSLWWTMVVAALRSALQHRANFLLSGLAGALVSAFGLILMWLITSRFQEVGGWSFAMLAVVYGLRQTVHGIWVTIAGDLVNMPRLVIEGRMDRFLLRPISPLLQVMSEHVNVGALGELAGGLVMLFAGAQAAGIAWTPGNVAFLVLAIAGGVGVHGSFYLAFAALSIRLMEARSLLFVVHEIFATFGGYPVHAFSKGAQIVFSFALPLAFIAYVPAAVLLDATGQLTVPIALAYASPLVGAALFGGALLVWRGCINHYQSSGS